MSSGLKQVRLKLDQLRDSPAGTQDAPEDVLGLIYGVLIKDSTPSKAHWFCSRADKLTIDAATFLLRLHAYNSPRVKVWRSHLQACLKGCAGCVQGMQEAKITSRHTYFGAFSDGVLGKFWTSFSEWEVTAVLEGLKEAGVEPAREPRRTLSSAPPALVYWILSNARILEHDAVLEIVRECAPTSTIPSWPADIPPIGLLLLLMHEDTTVRAWALSQASSFKITPLKSEQFLPGYVEALGRTTKLIGLFDVNLLKVNHADDAAEDIFPFSRDPSQLWSGFGSFLRFVPPERFRPSELFRLDLRRVVIGHLSDPGSHFVHVLRCFLLILARIGPDMWQGEGTEYPLVVFNAIKDNPSYLEALQSGSNNDQEPWTLTYLNAYLKSLDRLPTFKDTIPAVMQFLCEELQHERFERIQPSAIGIAAKILSTMITGLSSGESGKDTQSTQLYPLWESLDIHASRLVAIAFGKLYTAEAWKTARSEARQLIKTTLLLDVKNVVSAITHLSIPAKYPDPPVSPNIRDQLWRKLYETIHHEDVDGVATILRILSQISHVDYLADSAFADVIKQSKHPAEAQKVFGAINRALGVFRNGFPDAVSRILDFSSSAAMVRLLRQESVTQDIMTLMISPIEDIQQAAQAVAGLALDVETRQDCFRALLTNAPNAALNGMFSFLETFSTFARTVPEACSVSKSLALCFTDIIDVMCSPPDGLLLKEKFTKTIADPGAAVELPKWWTLMTNALSIIFLRTPRWAVYFENRVMVEWMRDALIFGRDLLAQRKVIENGALGPENASSSKRKLSHIGKKMVDDLQQVLQELTRWLRLTDEELLFQSFALLESLLSSFRELQVDPVETTLQKLQKHVDDARKKDPARPQTRLDATRLARLQEALSSFEDDDDIEIISHTKAPSRPPTVPEKKRLKDGQLHFPKVEKPTKPSTSEVIQIRAPVTKKSSAFTAEDQKRLNSASTLPKFTKSSVVTSKPTASSSKAETATKPSKASVVASSSSESESDDDAGGTLASLAKIQRTPTVKKPTERRQVKMMDLPGNARNAALDRINRRDDARRTGLRLKPDISALHRRLLSWDYDHTGPSPPGEDMRVLNVPDTFTDIHHYRRVFEPLLLLECWAQLQNSKEEPQDQYQCNIAGRQYTDDWADVEAMITEPVKSDWFLTDTDVIVLTFPGSPKKLLAKVTSSKTGPMGIQLSFRLHLSGQDLGPQAGSTWNIQKVLSLTTLHREYAALMGLPYFDLVDTILRPELPKSHAASADEVRQTMATYKLNEPQAKAILTSMNTDGFALIQGPPGTGKTSTICGLVQLFMARRPKPTTAIHAGRTAGPADREPVKKILLCAPSNAAIDEITYRLKEGISGGGRKESVPKVVRVGAPKGMHISIKDVSLDYLVDQKLNGDSSKSTIKDASSEISLIRSQLEALKSQRSRKIDEKNDTHDNSAKVASLEEEIKGLNKQRWNLTHQLDRLRDKQKSDNRTLDAINRRYRSEVISEADVICTTLAGAGHDQLEAFDFEMVVIDEAAQSIELSSLIPLKYRCNRCIMVGDPQQLPPTVISMEATKFSYNQSLFVRLQKRRPDAVQLLSIQYRMHPEISRLPSNLFYGGRLQDGPEMALKTKKPWHVNAKFGTYKFYNVARGQEQKGSHRSLVNRTESQIAVALYNRLITEYSSYDFEYKVGVVSMYRAQVGEIRRAFEQRFGSNILATVDFNTVDGFQGQEKEIIILSCVRAGPGLQNVGFLSDIRRMNVALTRAKSSVFILGHAPTLERSDPNWRSIVSDARERACLIETDTAYFTSPDGRSASTSSVTPKPVKPVSKVARNAVAVPDDLQTPQQLASAGRAQVSPPSKRKDTILAAAAAPPKSEASGSVVPAQNTAPPVVPRKRPPEDSEESAPPTVGEGREMPPQQRPRPKRPKAAPSLFIPKKR